MINQGLMYQITTPNFIAGFILNGGVVIAGQDKLKYMAGWNLWQVIAYCDHHGWEFKPMEWPQ